MPLYEYECDACRQRFERIQKFSDPPPEACPSCGGAVKKLFSSPAIQFKGSGWYITDYARKPAADSGKDSKTAASADGGGGAKESGAKDSGGKDSGGKESGTAAAKDGSAPSTSSSKS